MRVFVSIFFCAVSFSFAFASYAADALQESPLTSQDFSHWAFRRLERPLLPVVQNNQWPRTPVDQFVLARQERFGFQPLAEADRETLLRRLTFSLTGLPPSLDELKDFVADETPDAVEKLLDRLLASPAYAERAAQHWLDLARFAESDGFEFDTVRPNAWRYRDWVIDAFARDLPYDELVRRQLAGDLLEPHDSSAAIPTGFLLCGPDMPDQNNQEERRHLILNELTATVGSVFLGLQVGCAECHNHKFDPISQADFYRLRAFFESVQIFKDHPVPNEHERTELRAAQAKRGEEVQRTEARLTQFEELGAKRARDKNPDFVPKKPDILAALSKEEREEHAVLAKAAEKFGKPPPVSLGRVVLDGPPRVAKFFVRGDFRNPGPELMPGFPRIANEHGAQPVSLSNDSVVKKTGVMSRVALADWLVRADNPLATRTIANRLWQQHFVRPLTTTPSDLGLMGDAPSHPELLDWLATELPAQGWSLKRMHRLLASSATFRQGSRQRSAISGQPHRKSEIKNQKLDNAENRLLVGMNPRRLDGEEIRDAMLAASGLLDRRRHGPGVQPPLPAEITATLLKNQWTISPHESDHYRRSVYLFVRRNLRFPLLDVFDRPDTNASCAQRNRSTIAPQALTLLNSELTQRAAKQLADSVSHEASADEARRLDLLFRKTLGREPTPDEKKLAVQLLAALTAEPPTAAKNSLTALSRLTAVIFNLNEFVYVD